LYPIDKTPLKNDAQKETAFHLKWDVTQYRYNLEALKKDVNTLLELYKIADKNLKLKNDKPWVENNLSKADKGLEQVFKDYTEVVEQVTYWYDNLNWLQSRFPDAKYKDITGLCKMADRKEYAFEQDYSLNAGRYVGIEIEDDNTTSEEFKTIILDKAMILENLERDARALEKLIHSNLNELFV